MSRQRQGTSFVLISACAFGAMAIFAKQAYAAGFGVAPLLACRFALAATALWLVLAVRRPARPSRRTVVTGLTLGAGGYALQAGLYFAALTHIDASLTALLLYTYPVIVVVAAIALGRESASPRRLGALALACAGVLLVLAGGGIGGVDGVGVALGLGCAVVYAGYILTVDHRAGDADPLLLAALVMTGAAASTWTFTIARGGPDLHVAAAGWGWLACIVVVSTVLGAVSFFAGMARVGPSAASILSTFEPVVTVGLAMVVFGEALGAEQLAGGALVLAAVVVLQRRAPGTVTRHGPPDHLAAAAPAGALAR